MELVVDNKGEIMKKTIGILVVMLFLATLCYAQSSRLVTTAGGSFSSKTNFTYLSVGGSDVAGNPGFLEMQGFDESNVAFLYYLWVDDTGDLCIASNVTLDNYTSYPTGDWTTGMDAACTVVGTQS